MRRDQTGRRRRPSRYPLNFLNFLVPFLAQISIIHIGVFESLSTTFGRSENVAQPRFSRKTKKKTKRNPIGCLACSHRPTAVETHSDVSSRAPRLHPLFLPDYGPSR